MGEEEALKHEARLLAIEHAICELFSAIYRNIPAHHVHTRHDELLRYVRLQTVSGVHPVESDMLSAELETAFRALLTMIEKHAQKPRPKAEDK